MSQSNEVVANALEHLQIANALIVASATVLAYDYALTFDLEVSLMWPSGWSLTKVLFLLTRYLPFSNIAILFWTWLTPGIANSSKVCLFAYESTGWLSVIGIGIAELILTLRTWAVWGKDRRLTIGLPIIIVIVWGSAFSIMGLFTKTLTFETSPTLRSMGCLLSGGSPILFVCWVLLMIYEAIILALMVVWGVKAYRSAGHSDLFHVVYWDGIVYYVYLFGLSLLDVIIIVTLPHQYAGILSPVECVAHSVLTSRVILHIREQAQKDATGTIGNGSITMQTMAFREPQAETEV